jgi:hypothetical protein
MPTTNLNPSGSSILSAPIYGETVYSIAARYRVSNRQGPCAPGNLFGGGRPASSLLPTKLRALISHLPSEFRCSTEEFALRHSALPVYLPFIDEDRARRAFSAAAFGGPLHLILGAAAGGSLESPKLRLCPACVRAERQIFGYPIWHREHQFASVLVCARHRTALSETDLSPRALFASPAFYTAAKAIGGEPIPLPPDPARGAIRLSRDVSYLLEHPINGIGMHRVHAAIYQALRDHQYVRLDGSVRVTRLTRNFLNYFGTAFLDATRLRPARSVHSNWVTQLVRRPMHLPSPMRILAFARFLGFDAASFLDKARAIAPLASRPPARPHRLRIRSPELLSRLRPIRRASWLARNGPSMARPTRNLYGWLWRNDRTWLLKHRGPAAASPRIKKRWDALDEKLSNRIADLAASVGRMNPPTRASRHRLASLSGAPALLLTKHPSLPQSVSCLNRVSESAEAFSCRRIIRAAKQDACLRRAAPWRLRVAAGVGAGQMSNPLVRRAFALARSRPTLLPK